MKQGGGTKAEASGEDVENEGPRGDVCQYLGRVNDRVNVEVGVALLPVNHILFNLDITILQILQSTFDNIDSQ